MHTKEIPDDILLWINDYVKKPYREEKPLTAKNSDIWNKGNMSSNSNFTEILIRILLKGDTCGTVKKNTLRYY